jgi:hypothetical protein
MVIPESMTDTILVTGVLDRRDLSIIDDDRSQGEHSIHCRGATDGHDEHY